MIEASIRAQVEKKVEPKSKDLTAAVIHPESRGLTASASRMVSTVVMTMLAG